MVTWCGYGHGFRKSLWRMPVTISANMTPTPGASGKNWYHLSVVRCISSTSASASATSTPLWPWQRVVWRAAPWRITTWEHCQTPAMLNLGLGGVPALAGRAAADVAGVSLWRTAFGWRTGMRLWMLQPMLHSRQPRRPSSGASWTYLATPRCSPAPCPMQRPPGCWTSPCCAATSRRPPTWPRPTKLGRFAGGGEMTGGIS